MLATLPKHKGTEKLQADLKHRLSQARRESQKKGAAHSAPAYLVKREGAGQIALVGPAELGQVPTASARLPTPGRRWRTIPTPPACRRPE